MDTTTHSRKKTIQKYRDFIFLITVLEFVSPSRRSLRITTLHTIANLTSLRLNLTSFEISFQIIVEIVDRGTIASLFRNRNYSDSGRMKVNWVFVY